jgi:uncharacterized membrane protein YedE/YeeE
MSAPAPPVPRSYWNPYAAGLALGFVLLAAFLAVGRGLGASGAIVRIVAVTARAVAPAHAAANPIYRGAGGEEGGAFGGWLLLEVAGMMLGGALSARLAGRWRGVVLERGTGTPPGSRLALAFTGGAVMAFGARLARGCTSGQALSGGAVLAAGSWAFMIALFVGAYATVGLARRQWQ